MMRTRLGTVSGLTGVAVMLMAAPALAAPVASRAPFGEAANGDKVELITLQNDKGMTVRFTTRGATITEISAPDRKGASNNLVLGRPGADDWNKGSNFNSIVGRYANRISNGGFTLDGVFHALQANPNTHVTLHSGRGGFGEKLLKTETFQRGDRAGAVMTYVSPDGEGGFPGEMSVKVIYSLDNNNVLRLEYEATTTKPTVINLTNHTYFNIGGYDSGPVYDQVLRLFASRWTPTDENLVPTGEIASVEGTPFDFRRPTAIAKGVYSTHPQILLGRGIDHNFVLDKPAGAGALSVAARLRDPKSGRQMEVRTTEPAVQIYTANGFNGAMVGANSRALRQGDGIAFETQHFPDSPNKPNFPTTVLRPGQTFHSITEYAFSTDATPFR